MTSRDCIHLIFSLAVCGIITAIYFGNTSHLTSYGERMPSKITRVQQTFLRTKTVCIGRFLVDVPEHSTVVYGPSHAPWPIQKYLGDAKNMESLFSERLAEAEAEKHMARGGLRGKESLVGTAVNGAARGQKIVFGVSKGNWGKYKIDSYFSAGENLYVQSADPIPSERNEAIEDLNAIALVVKARDKNEIPTESGVCLDGAFIGQTARLTYEAFNLGVRLQEFPDVHFSLSVTKKDVLVESDALEPRLRQAEEMVNRSGQGGWYSRIKTLRRGRRQIAHWHGFEMLAWKPAQAAESESHEFLFVSQGQPNNALQPVLELELHTGVSDNQVGAVKPSLTDEEALAVWDRLTSSIRVRPYK